MKIKFITLVMTCLFPLLVIANENKIVGDINCDGKEDIAKMTSNKSKVMIYVTLNDGTKSNEIEFGLGESGYQDSLCGIKPILSSEELVEEMIGYKPSKSCIGLNIRAGECDSMHLFWNKETGMLNWWRL